MLDSEICFFLVYWSLGDRAIYSKSLHCSDIKGREVHLHRKPVLHFKLRRQHQRTRQKQYSSSSKRQNHQG